MSQLTFPNSISWAASFTEYPGLTMQDGISRQSNIIFTYSNNIYSTIVDIAATNGIFSKYQTNSFAVFDMTTQMVATNSGSISISTQGVVNIMKSTTAVPCVQVCSFPVNKGENVSISFTRNNPGVNLSIKTNIVPQKNKLQPVSSNMIIPSNQRKKINFNIPAGFNSQNSTVIITSLPKYGQLYYQSEYAALNKVYTQLQSQDLFYKSIQGIGYDFFSYKYGDVTITSDDCTLNVVVYPTEIPNLLATNQYFQIRQDVHYSNQMQVSFTNYQLLDPIPPQVPGPRVSWSLQGSNDIVSAVIDTYNGTVSATGLTTGQTTLIFSVTYGSLDQFITANGKILVDVLRGAATAPAIAGGSIGIVAALIGFGYLGFYIYNRFFLKKNEDKVFSN